MRMYLKQAFDACKSIRKALRYLVRAVYIGNQRKIFNDVKNKLRAAKSSLRKKM